MEPRIAKVEAFTVVGMRVHGKNENDEIPQMWQAFGARAKEIKHLVNPHVCYGICANMDESTGAFDYVVGIEVDNIADLPEGMVSWNVPEGTYAVFTCTLPTVGETFRHAYHTWLPQSGYQLTGGPDFELYDEHFDPQDPGSKMDVYIPIK
jgi:AraC family transcriptional regulator